MVRCSWRARAPIGRVVPVIVDSGRRVDAAGGQRVVPVIVERRRGVVAVVVDGGRRVDAAGRGRVVAVVVDGRGRGLRRLVAGVLVVVRNPPSKREMSSGSGVVPTEDAAASAPAPARAMATVATAVVIKDFFMARAPLAMRGVEVTSSPSPRAGAAG